LAAAADTLKHTPLHARHAAAGAKLVDFAGWEMPVQYGNIREEHQAVRTDAGIFDVSHMGEIETTGPDAEAFLQRILSNDVTKLAADGAQYAVLTREDGGVLDDLFTYRLGTAGDRFLTVTNAANHAKDLAWFQAQAGGFDVAIHDRLADYAMLAVQGPRARALLEGLLGDGQSLPARFRTATLTVAGAPGVLVAGTGYTGEDGVELLVAPERAVAVWDAVVGAGAAPIGLAARDTLRLEVCFHLYGNDLMETRGPIEAGLGWCCKEATGFIGSEAVAKVRAEGPPEKLVPFRIDGAGIARQGNPVLAGGEVTSGTHSPSLGAGIGMAYVPAELATPGTPIEIDVRGKVRRATVAEKPLYKREDS
jgi:aminomethyltransferase